MQDFFSSIYMFLHGVQQDPIWDEVYLTSGMVLLVATVISSVVYYYVLNSFFMNWFRIRSWFFVLFINAILVMLIAISIASNMLQVPAYNGIILSFGAINILYAAILFALLPFVISWWSPRAPHTPYRFFVKK